MVLAPPVGQHVIENHQYGRGQQTAQHPPVNKPPPLARRQFLRKINGHVPPLTTCMGAQTLQRAAAHVAGTSAPPSSLIRAPKRSNAGWGEIFPAIRASP
jgi:hypothetical protein